MKRTVITLLLALSLCNGFGCQRTPTKPVAPLSADEEQKLQEQLQKARAAEGASQPR